MGVGEEREGIRCGGLMLISSCWSVPRMGQPPGQWLSQPRVMVGERFRSMTPERLSGPEALRQRLAVMQRDRERKLAEREPQRIPGTETQRAKREERREPERQEAEKRWQR